MQSQRAFPRRRHSTLNCVTAGASPIRDTDEAVWYKTMDVNINGVVLVSKYGGRFMLECGNGGRIVMIASLAGRVGLVADRARHPNWPRWWLSFVRTTPAMSLARPSMQMAARGWTEPLSNASASA